MVKPRDGMVIGRKQPSPPQITITTGSHTTLKRRQASTDPFPFTGRTLSGSDCRRFGPATAMDACMSGDGDIREGQDRAAFHILGRQVGGYF